jgi:hypothetical protein
MGVAQLTLSCDRLFITNLCFIRLFPISSIWRAVVVRAPRMRGFPFLTRRACAESNARSDPSPPRSSIPTKRALVPAGNRDSRSSRANRPLASTSQHQYKGWLCAVRFRSDPDHGSGLHACPSEIGGPDRTSARHGISLHGLRASRLNRREFGGLKSAACGSRPRRAYRPYRSCGRVAEGGGLLKHFWLYQAVAACPKTSLFIGRSRRSLPSPSLPITACP